MATRVLLLTQWFDPEPVPKGLAFARELARQGFEVEVVTGFPNYPGGQVYPGYRIKWLQREVMDGVQVTRVPLYPSHDRSALKRVLNYLSFAASSLVYGLFMARRPDVIYAYHPPLTVGITAALLRLLRRIPVVYDIQDMWPDTLRVTGMLTNTRILGMVETVCRWVYRRVDQIVVLSPGFKRLLVERGVPAAKVEVIYNWADEAALAASGSEVASLPGGAGFRLMFAGNMGKAQALDSVLEAAGLLQERGVRARIYLLGGGLDAPRLRARAEELGLTNIHFLPPVPMSEVGRYLLASDALLVHLRKDPLFEITIPSKTQAYMAMGRPLLLAVAGDAARLGQEAGAGLVVDPEDPQALAAAVEAMAAKSRADLERMGEQGRSFYQEHLALAVGAAKFAALFRQVAKQ
jgi:glycosyltransferase involved in cell wall biosynthesis